MNTIQKIIFSLFTAFIITLSASISFAYEEKARPDAHAPIDVMAEHSHKAGEFMFSYRFKYTEMDDNLSGSSRLVNSEILAGEANSGSYMLAPLSMSMEMHMFGLMYAPNDTNTFMLMIPYTDISMKHIIGPMHPMSPNEEFTTHASGIGDIQISNIVTLKKTVEHSLLMNIGLSVPTGSTHNEDSILSLPALGNTQLPFPMQIGSGTYDLLPAITYNRIFNRRSFGTQLSSIVRLGRNDNGYSLGNKVQLQTWHAWVINTDLSFSTRLNLEQWENIDGDDDKRKIPATIIMGENKVGSVPTVDPQNQGGLRADIALGLNGVYGKEQHRVGLEVVVPVQQHLNGIQLERDLSFVMGYQKAF
jgi:hypothetical protein